MSFGYRFLGLTLLAQQLISHCTCNHPDWHGGDWAMEILKATDEPIGVKGEWSNYLHTLEDDKKREDTTTKQIVTSENAAPSDWRPLTPNEIPYLAVLYRRDHGPSQSYKQFFQQETDPVLLSHVEPGTACGGALLTATFVLSVCGCLMSLIAHVQGVTSPSEKDNTFKDIYNIYDSLDQYRKVYVTHSLVQFAPDFKHGVNQNPNKWPKQGTMNCRDLLVKLNDRNWNQGVRDDGKKAELVNSHLVLVPVSPAVKPDSSPFFPHWPPRPVNDEVDPDFLQRAALISIGMRFAKPPEKEFFSSVSASSVEMKHCNAEPVNTSTCNNTRVPRGNNYTCFCPIITDYNLCGGTIGWPIVQYGELVGLSASGRDSQNGYVAAAILSREYITLIQNLIGNDLLADQKTPAPMYRQKDLAKKYFIYDYDAFRDKFINGPTPASMATIKAPEGFLIFASFITWISIALVAAPTRISNLHNCLVDDLF